MHLDILLKINFYLYIKNKFRSQLVLYILILVLKIIWKILHYFTRKHEYSAYFLKRYIIPSPQSKKITPNYVGIKLMYVFYI